MACFVNILQQNLLEKVGFGHRGLGHKGPCCGNWHWVNPAVLMIGDLCDRSGRSG